MNSKLRSARSRFARGHITLGLFAALVLTACGDDAPTKPATSSSASESCVSGEQRVGTTPCGVNDEGVLMQRCVDGAWADDSAECSGAAGCVIGSEDIQACEDGGSQRRVCVDGQWGAWEDCVPPGVPGCTDPDGTNYDPEATLDDGSCDHPESSPYFLSYAEPDLIPGRFPSSPCDALKEHHECVTTQGCSWMRTIKSEGTCRRDPVSRCLEDGECECRAHDFHGAAAYEQELKLFLPLSVTWANLAPNAGTGGAYSISLSMPPIVNESLENFTSRTDFTRKTLQVDASDPTELSALGDGEGLSVVMKFMHVWDKQPDAMSGTLFEGLGMRVVLDEDQLSLIVGESSVPISGGHVSGDGRISDYQCNQLAVVVGAEGGAKVYLGGVVTMVPDLTMDTVRSHVAANSQRLMTVGSLNAKVWDLRLYGEGRQLSADEVATIGKRCGSAGDYPIPDGYPESNARYSWGMGGYNIVPNHETQGYSSGVYVTMRIPEPDAWPPSDPIYIDNLKRMIGFWDRWHEQMFFELDMIPYVDTRQLDPAGSANTYRNYEEPLCELGEGCGEPSNYNNPCRYVTDLFQAFNWLPEDFPDEPTSADHRKIAERGGWTRWDAYDSDYYGSWGRPVHEHGHTAHFTLMRSYRKVHHYIRGIAGEGFAEIMSFYLLAGAKSWMNLGLTYYPTIPLAFEGRWDPEAEKHVFKSSQPYQEKNIDDLGLGARFYGLGVWWTYVSHYAAKPYLIGRLSGETDQTPGTTLQWMRYYLAQEGLDFGELFANYAAHVATWDWPHTGHYFHQQEQEPFEGIERWCTENSGPDCTIDSLKIQVELDAETGTEGQWVSGPEGLDPGGFAYSTIRIKDAPPGAVFELGLNFEVPSRLYPGTDYHIGLTPTCKDDPRFFSSRVVVVDAGTEGQEERARRPQYYKIPGRSVDRVIIQVPEGSPANIYLLAIPTPPFELEDVPGFVKGTSLVWPFQYKVTRLASLPEDAQPQEPIILEGDNMLDLTPRDGHGFVYDCFHRP